MSNKIPAQYNRWLEIDLDVLQSNYQVMRAYLPANIAIMAVVKANAYGYGAIAAAAVFEKCGVDALAVTTIDEAIELRENGITTPILVFSPLLAEEAELFFDYNLLPTISNKQGLLALGAACGSKSISCHLKINTGMNRIGLLPEQLPDILEILKKSTGLTLAGVYSHFATALDNNPSFSQKQLQTFNIALKQIEANGFSGFTPHVANSAGALKFTEARYGMVRLGSILYGQLGLAKTLGLNLKDPFTAKAKIVDIQEVTKGDSVGYGRDFIAGRNLRLGVIPLGYADGFAVSANARPLNAKRVFQAMSRDMGKVLLRRSKQCVVWNGSLLPIVGRVAMQSAVIDISSVKASLGHTVVVPLRRTSANARLPRFYLSGGRIVDLKTIISATGLEKQLEKN